MAKDRKLEPCAGCGKDVDITWGRHTHDKELADGKTYVFCPGRSRGEVSGACLDKALKRMKICPGCGRHDEVAPGFICRDCRRDLEQGRALVARATGLQWYGIDPRSWIPRTSQDSDLGDLASTAFHALAEAFTVGRTTHRVEQNGGWSGRSAEMLVPDGYEHRWVTQASGPGFEATPEQAAALKVALAALRDGYLAQRQRGRREGQALLFQLASGAITLDDFDKRHGTLLALKDVDDTKRTD